MTPRTASIAAAAAIAAALILGQLSADAQTDRFDTDRSVATDVGLSLGPVPEELTPERLPDLVPVGSGDEVWGYAYSRDVFADLIDPNAVVAGYDIYEADGKTKIGRVSPGRGFEANTSGPQAPVAASD